jgi:two-component system, chemotaxis family, chemotaxis protein CheY
MSLNLSMPVLVVNDHQTTASIVSNVLRQIGFEHVDAARNAAAALKKLNCKNYGLVISDDTMKPVSGGELLREIRSNPRLAATPFLLLTAGEQKTKENAPCATFARPFNAQMLHRQIAAVLTN